MTYNVHKGRSFFLRQRIWKKLHEIFLQSVPDVIFLQEFYREPQAEEFLERMADSFWPHHSYGKNAFVGDFHCGNAILSKHPIKNSLYVDISTNEWEKRGLLYSETYIGKHPIHLFCTHFDLLSHGRNIQKKMVLSEIEKIAGDKQAAILGGDFNDWSQVLHFGDLHFKDCFFELHGRSAKTAPSFFPSLALDRVYARNVVVKSASVINPVSTWRLTDHLPVIVEIALR